MQRDGQVYFTVTGTSLDTHQHVTPPANSAWVPEQGTQAGGGSGRQWCRPVERGPRLLRTAHWSLSSLSAPASQPPFLLPSTCSHLPSNSDFCHQHSVSSSSEITPSLLPLGSKTQRGDSLAWAPTASPLPGPVAGILSSVPYPTMLVGLLTPPSEGRSQGLFFLLPQRGDGTAP